MKTTLLAMFLIGAMMGFVSGFISASLAGATAPRRAGAVYHATADDIVTITSSPYGDITVAVNGR